MVKSEHCHAHPDELMFPYALKQKRSRYFDNSWCHSKSEKLNFRKRKFINTRKNDGAEGRFFGIFLKGILFWHA